MALEKIEARVLSVLRDRGLLLFTDSHATSVVSLVTGAQLRETGSPILPHPPSTR